MPFVKRLKDLFRGCKFSHIWREANGAADLLASFGCDAVGDGRLVGDWGFSNGWGRLRFILRFA